MSLQVKSALEIRNRLKEAIKGTYLEGFIRQLYAPFKHQKNTKFSINSEDNNLTIKILHRILNEKSNCIDIGPHN
ncbi:MAG: hypothetical protein SAK29_32875 [Scytonema sp. PMC 1069.18]|nr:hypothetical protein [Scytonema sp. PMC 1069.18]MEC4883207.1 hypothetical protein [Scytonema sp. PMC 1070.18]